jgi:RNAse P Rpr2/Rpp21/SNM1 subunit domain
MAKSRSENLQVVFLESSSQYLAASTPSTSAHLMTERLALLSEDEQKQKDILRHNVCSACGTATTLGWTATTARQTRSTRRQVGGRKERIIVCVCLVCHRESVTTLPVAPKAVKTAQAKSMEPMSSRMEVRTSPTISEKIENASNKRRAKTRKEKSGLQALLNKSKQITTASSTLDLMDFMKP